MKCEDTLIIACDVCKSRVEKLTHAIFLCSVESDSGVVCGITCPCTVNKSHLTCAYLIYRKNTYPMSKTCCGWSAIGTYCSHFSMMFNGIRYVRWSRSMDENGINVYCKWSFGRYLAHSASLYGVDLRRSHSWYQQCQCSQ